MYIYIYTYLYVCVHMYIDKHMCISDKHMCVSTSIYIFTIYAYTYMRTYEYMSRYAVVIMALSSVVLAEHAP